jgi:hypothetical protein
MLNFEDTPWYETVRLFRQEKPGEWDGVFERVKQRLVEAAEQEPFSQDMLVFPSRQSYKSHG